MTTFSDYTAVVGLSLSRRVINAGDHLNLMLIAINTGEMDEMRDFVIYLQRSDLHSETWTLAAEQKCLCPVGEAAHVYFSLSPRSMAQALGYERYIKPCELFVWAACASPSQDKKLPEAEASTDFFCIQGSCRL